MKFYKELLRVRISREQRTLLLSKLPFSWTLAVLFTTPLRDDCMPTWNSITQHHHPPCSRFLTSRSSAFRRSKRIKRRRACQLVWLCPPATDTLVARHMHANPSWPTAATRVDRHVVQTVPTSDNRVKYPFTCYTLCIRRCSASHVVVVLTT